MANDYFDHPNGTRLEKGTKARADGVNSIFDSVTAGFDKMATPEQADADTYNYAGATTGSSNTYAATLTHMDVTPIDGQVVIFTANHANTGAATLNVTGLAAGTTGAIAIVTNDDAALAADSILASGMIEVRYSSTLSKWVLNVKALATGTAATTTLADAGGLYTEENVEAALQTGVVQTKNNQTIAGDKTFSGTTVIDDLSNPVFTGLTKHSIETGITAHAGGGQADAYVLTKEINEVSVCASSQDSVVLPSPVPGYRVTITNNGVNACAVYGTSGVDIGAGADNSQAVTNGLTAIYECLTATLWNRAALD